MKQKENFETHSTGLLICPIISVFLFFRKFVKWAVLVHNFLQENGTYRKNRGHYVVANVKCNKTVNSDFYFQNFVTDIPLF